MEALTANEAKSQFGDLLLKAQREPVQINKNGKPVAVVMSISDFEDTEALKLELLQTRALRAIDEVNKNQTIDGDQFFKSLDTNQ